MNDNTLAHGNPRCAALNNHTGTLVARKTRLQWIAALRQLRPVAMSGVRTTHRDNLKLYKALALLWPRAWNVHDLELMVANKLSCLQLAFTFALTAAVLTDSIGTGTCPNARQITRLTYAHVWSGFESQNRHSGFTGDPVPPRKRSGA